MADAEAVDRARQIVRAGLAEQNVPGLSVAVGVGGDSLAQREDPLPGPAHHVPGRVARVRRADPGANLTETIEHGFFGPLNWRDWDPQQYYNWRAYLDYGGGQVTDLFTHWIDVVHMFMGDEIPIAASASSRVRTW